MQYNSVPFLAAFRPKSSRSDSNGLKFRNPNFGRSDSNWVTFRGLNSSRSDSNEIVKTLSIVRELTGRKLASSQRASIWRENQVQTAPDYAIKVRIE